LSFVPTLLRARLVGEGRKLYREQYAFPKVTERIRAIYARSARRGGALTATGECSTSGKRALSVFEALAAIDPETFVEAVPYDARIFGVWSLDALGLCCFRLGRFAESARYYARAEGLTPDGGEYRAKRQLAEARASRESRMTATP
jgi:tetratricopeptide (TPR) repeat protein